MQMKLIDLNHVVCPDLLVVMSNATLPWPGCVAPARGPPVPRRFLNPGAGASNARPPGPGNMGDLIIYTLGAIGIAFGVIACIVILMMLVI